MKLTNLLRFSLLLAVVAAVALIGVTWAKGDDEVKTFSLRSLRGRYISAENAFDVSTSHDAGGGNVGAPVFFSAAAVMIADGKGNVCGESDGFYGGTPPPGVNLGPSFFYGSYTIDVNGRVVIITAPDTGFCATSAAITPVNTTGTTVFKTQVGYLSSFRANRLSTAEQINASDASKGGCCATTGFLVHHRNWTKEEED